MCECSGQSHCLLGMRYWPPAALELHSAGAPCVWDTSPMTPGEGTPLPGPSAEAVGSRKEEPAAPRSAMAVGARVGGSQEKLTWGWADSLLDSTSRSTGRAAKVPQSHDMPRVTHSQAATGAGPSSRELPLLGTCPVLCPCSQGDCNVASTFWALAACQGPLEALQKLTTCLCFPSP